MYKVFIENKPITFHFNSTAEANLSGTGKSDMELKEVASIWGKISKFLKDDNERELFIELKVEDDFFKVFDSYKVIEAAGGMVQREDQFLFIRRNGFWDIPKGKLEKGEQPEDGAVREIEEECGLIQPKIKDHLINTWHTYEHKGRNVLKKTYWYWLDEGESKTELIPQTEEGITEVAFFEIDQFDHIRQETFLSIIEVMDTLLKKM